MRPLSERAAPLLPGVDLDGPNPARVAGGRKALDHCVAWERYLELQHRRASGACVALLWQTGRPVIGYDPRTGAPKYGTAPSDFVGAIRAEAGAPWRPLVVEAKTRDRRVQRGDVDAHQQELLAAIERAGGVALVAIELRDAAGRWVIPWRDIEHRWNRARGGASVGPEELAGFELIDGPASYLAAFAPGGRHAPARGA